VRSLEAGAAATEFRVALDDRDAEGRPLTPGVYFYRVSAPGSLLTGRFVVIR